MGNLHLPQYALGLGEGAKQVEFGGLVDSGNDLNGRLSIPPE